MIYKMAGDTTETKKKKHKKKRKKWPVVIAVIAVALIAVRAAAGMGAAQPGVYVTTTSAVRGDLQESISTSGTVLYGDPAEEPYGRGKCGNRKCSEGRGAADFL